MPFFNNKRKDFSIQPPKQQVDSTPFFVTDSANIDFTLANLNLTASIENSNVGINIINYRSQLDRQREIENKLFKIKKTLDNPVPNLYLIDKGVPSFKKVYPSYALNALIAILFSLVISIILIVNKSKS